MDVYVRDLDLSGVSKVQTGTSRIQDGGWSGRLARKWAYLTTFREDIENFKRHARRYPYVWGCRSREAGGLAGQSRGNPNNLGEVVPRGFLSVLSKDNRLCFTKGSRRLELADAILASPDDAGHRESNLEMAFRNGNHGHSQFGFGERPVHPELIEYLADFFVRNGMSIKKLHREIMLSSVYQLSNESSKTNYDKDSANRLYWRSNRRRMDVEQIRDSLLATSGALDKKLGGPSEAMTPQSTRRTLYGKVSRYKLDDFLQLFDFPSPNISAEQRYATNVPLQRLFFMNSDFVQQQAELLVRRLESEPTGKRAYRGLSPRARARRRSKRYGLVSSILEPSH
jgi:hypothetical protein